MKIASLFPAPQPPALLQPEATSEASPRPLQDWLAEHRGDVEGLLLERGGILCRGFGIGETAQFRACVDVFGRAVGDYVGGNSPRTAVGEGVYTSTEYPAHAEISVHNELSYARDWPRLLFFCCAQPSTSGGQTTLTDGRALLASLPARIVEEFGAKGLLYVRNFHAGPLGRSWQTTYQTDDRAEAERRIRATGAELEWLDRDTLRVTSRGPAVTRHPDTGETVWFNQAEQWHPSALSTELRAVLEMSLGADRFPHDCRFGDGSPIAEADLALVRACQRRNYLLFDWRAGDLLLVDNVRLMHGRQPFQGPRRVLVAMA